MFVEDEDIIRDIFFAQQVLINQSIILFKNLVKIFSKYCMKSKYKYYTYMN